MSHTEEVVIPYRVNDWFPDLNADKKDKLKTFFDHLLKFNKVLSLLSQKTLPITDLIHFADSIIASRLINAELPPGATLFNVGASNGVPGIIYSILFPDSKIVFLETELKKAEFLRSCITVLKLTNATVNTSPLDQIPENSIQFCLARGFASLPKSLLALRRQVAKSGIFYHMKTDEWGMEMTQIPPQLCSIWDTALMASYKLPIGSTNFFLVKTKKIA